MSSITKSAKPKICRICKTKFQPERKLQFVCSYLCSCAYSNQLKQKAEKKAHKEALIRLKTRTQWLKEAQTIFNRYIRIRDINRSCISCNKPMRKKINAGHFKSVGAHPELRFDENNVHGQCEHCNSFLSGNILNYRKYLMEKIGIHELERIEGHNDAKHYTISDIKDIISTYKAKIKELSCKN